MVKSKSIHYHNQQLKYGSIRNFNTTEFQFLISFFSEIIFFLFHSVPQSLWPTFGQTEQFKRPKLMRTKLKSKGRQS